ncbi:hypothetical protein [Marinomonas gallaica]|nr:hypothetical protein [Marinomonas gallaica]
MSPFLSSVADTISDEAGRRLPSDILNEAMVDTFTEQAFSHIPFYA